MNSADNTILELLRSEVTVVSAFYNTVKLPLVNLDWNATSKPLMSVEQEMMNRVWRGYGNPHSCGTLTSQSSQKLIDEARDGVMSSIFGIRDMSDYLVEFGGDGSSYWLERISNELSVHADITRCIAFQRELHNSLIEPWLNNGAIILFKNLSWAIKLFQLPDSCNKTVILVSLSSHLTGNVFDTDKFRDFLNRIPNRPIIIVDATCYLAHNRLIPPNLTFDFLVFSGHKFPGGPGSSGCMIYNKRYERIFGNINGTKNVLAIARLGISTRLRSSLMISAGRDAGMDGRVGKIKSVFKEVSNHLFKYVVHQWDGGDGDMVVCFSVSMKNTDLVIHPQIVSNILLNLYGIQIRAGGQCADTTIAKTGIWEDLNNVDFALSPIMQPSVCRLSIPSYMLTDQLTGQIVEDFTELLDTIGTFMKFYIPTLDGWILHPEVDRFSKKEKYQHLQVSGSSGCSKCSKNKFRDTWLSDHIKESGISPRGIAVYSKLVTLVSEIKYDLSPGSEYHAIYTNPFRWFATYQDILYEE